jgi:probable HAF family extracellular repeat protein
MKPTVIGSNRAAVARARALLARRRDGSRHTHRIAAALVGAAVFAAAPAVAEETYFLGLGDLPGGSHISHAYRMSADAGTVVGFSSSGREHWGEPFQWTLQGGIQDLGDVPGEDRHEGVAFDVSADGAVIVGQTNRKKHIEAFRWTPNDGIVHLGTLGGKEWVYSSARGVSGDGAVIVGESPSQRTGMRPEAFRWTAEDGMQPLVEDFDPDLHPLVGWDTSRDGSVVVGVADTPEGFEAYRWTETDGLLGLGHLYEQRASWARAVSADGTTIVGKAQALHDGRIVEVSMRWTGEEGMVELGDLFGPYGSEAWGVSADGSVIVGTEGTRGGTTPFIGDIEHGERDLVKVLTEDYGLDLGDWHLISAQDVSDDGLTIVGTGGNPNGNTEAWIAHIPEPASSFLLAAALMFVRRRGQLDRRATVDPRRLRNPAGRTAASPAARTRPRTAATTRSSAAARGGASLPPVRGPGAAARASTDRRR